ncbi:MAG: hypothetical protein LBS62_01945 [Clostridiales bacterium]|jgi:hypothetical protein|nr:hypothetical protein [Clostridiales bacterium]
MELENMLNNLWTQLNNPQNNPLLLLAFLTVCALAVILRVIVCAGYQGAYTVFRLGAREIPAKSDLGHWGKGILSRVVHDYALAGERGAASISAGAIVDKHILKLSFIGWSYRGMENLVRGLEQGMPVIAALLAITFYDNYRLAYALAGAGAFLLFRLLDSLLDFGLAREKLTRELTEYVEREAGQFYGGDIASGFLRFKNAVETAFSEQTKILRGEREYIEANQHALEKNLSLYEENLETSLRQYEQSLQAAAEKVGGGMGAIMEYQAQSAYGSLNSALQENIFQITNSNMEFTRQLRELLDQLSEQSRRSVNIIMKVKEQLDARFESDEL